MKGHLLTISKSVIKKLFQGEYDAALKLHQAHLAIARNLQDRAGMGRAYGNIGNAYSAAGFYESAIKYHKQELTISKEVHDRSSEASTHGNLAVAYQALGAHDMALLHYRAHLGNEILLMSFNAHFGILS